jgi:hypothetical protein
VLRPHVPVPMMFTGEPERRDKIKTNNLDPVLGGIVRGHNHDQLMKRRNFFNRPNKKVRRDISKMVGAKKTTTLSVDRGQKLV